MRWAALTSGGKDSILAIQKAIDAGMDVRYMVTVRPGNPHSYMFHSSNLDAVPVIAEVAGMEYVEVQTQGIKEEEVDDLREAMEALPIAGFTTGAVASEYQRTRLEKIADRCGCEVFAPLWHMEPMTLLREVAERMDAIIVVTAADGLDDSFLGTRIDESLISRLAAVARKHRIHPAGEGGEYETLTLYAPFYRRRITYATERRVVTPGRSELILGGFA